MAASARANRRRSLITVIAPGEEAGLCASGGVKDSPKSDHDTFDSFKAKPHPLPPCENTGNYPGNPVQGGPPPAVMNGGLGVVNGGRHPQYAPPYPTGPVSQAAAPPSGAVVPLPPLSASPQQAQKGSSRRGAAARLADMHLFPMTPPTNGHSARGNTPSRDTVNPVVAAPMPTRPSPLNAAAVTEDGAHLRYSAPSGTANERRQGSARSGGDAANAEPVISALEVVGPRRSSSRTASSSRAASEAPAANQASGNGKTGGPSARGSATASPPAPPSTKSNPQRAAVRTTLAASRPDASGGSETPALPQAQRRGSAPPLQPGSTWTTAAQRQAVGSARSSSSAPAEVASGAAGRRATFQQARPQLPLDVARVPRPPLRRPEEQQFTVARRIEAGNSDGDYTDSSAQLSRPTSSKSDRSVGSSMSFRSSTDEEDARNGATGDSSIVIDDTDADTPPDMVADATAVPRSVSPPPALSLYLLSGSTSKAATEVAAASDADAGENEASPVASPLMRSHGADVRLPSVVSTRETSSTAEAAAESANASCGSFSSVSTDDVRSTADFSVVTDAASLGTASPPRMPRKETKVFSKPTAKSAGNALTAADADTSISSYGLLGEDVYGATAGMKPATPEPSQKPPRPTSRTSEGARAGLPSPVEMSSVMADPSATENEWSISAPVMSLSARPRSNFSSSSNSSNTRQQRHDGKVPRTVLVESTSSPNADAGNPLVTHSYGNWSFSNVSAHSGDAKGETASRLSAADTRNGTSRSGSPSLAPSRGKSSAAAAASAEALKKAEDARWRVTQSLSIDPELFSFSQSLAAKPTSSVARLRKVFESSKDRRSRPATASNAGDSSAAATTGISSPSPMVPKSPFSPVNAVPKSNGIPARTQSAGSRKSSPSAPRRTAASSMRAPANPDTQSSFTAAPSVVKYSLSAVSPPPPPSLTAAKLPLPPLCPAVAQNSGSEPHYSLTSSYLVGSPMARRSGKDASRDWSAARDSAGVLPTASLQRSDPGFSLPSFKDSNLSLDMVNMYDGFEA